MPEVVARKRTRPASLPEVRKRVRPGAASTTPVEEPSAPRAKFARRIYNVRDAEELAGTPEDPVARGAYANAGIMDFSVFSEGPGDKMVGKIWKRDDGKYHVWGITPDGFLKYRGLQSGGLREVSDRLHAACRAIALARSRHKNSAIHYQEYKTK